jgi:hypothetical protein
MMKACWDGEYKKRPTFVEINVGNEDLAKEKLL